MVKKVTNNTSADLSDWKYPVNVTCDGGPDASFNLLDGHSDVVNNIPLGIDCKVGEDSLPLPDKGCPRGTVPLWTTTNSPAGYVHAGDTVTVHNVLDCVTPGEPSFGTLTVKKTIIYDTMDITGQPMGDFQVTVSCTTPVSVQTITLTHASNYQASTSNLAVGSQCTFTEVLPQNPNVLPPGYQWVATYPAGNQVIIQPGNQTLPLKNERVHNTVSPSEAELDVIKYFTINGALDPNHTMTFQVTVSCTDANGVAASGFSPPVVVNLTPNFITYLDNSIGAVTYSAWTSLPVPLGSTCTISEPLPPPSADLSACSWAPGTPTYGNRAPGSPPQTGPSITLNIAQQPFALYVNNQLLCPPLIVVPPPPNTQTRVCPLLRTMPDGSCCPEGRPWNGRSCGKAPKPTCPPNTTGKYPDCKAIKLTCPSGTTGIYPHCKNTTTRHCPSGYFGTYPNCRKATNSKCPPGTSGIYPICVQNPVCPDGMSGIYPNCTPILILKCPEGTTGVYPNCKGGLTMGRAGPCRNSPRGVVLRSPITGLIARLSGIEVGSELPRLSRPTRRIIGE